MEADSLIGLLQNYAEQIDIHLHQNHVPESQGESENGCGTHYQTHWSGASNS